MLSALPEMLQTVGGPLFEALKLKEEECLLMRGGTASAGLTVAAIVPNKDGIYVGRTTRRKESRRMNGIDGVFIDDGNVAGQIESKDEKFDKVLELIGTTTLRDSLRWTKSKGIVCLMGMVLVLRELFLPLLYNIMCAETCLMSAYSRSCSVATFSIEGTELILRSQQGTI